jgi:flavin-dependent dehydrogenase
VGDAGGLIDPFSGEGIHSAILSGMIAAKHLSIYLAGEAADLQGYRKEIEETLLEEIRVSYQLFMLFHLVPPLLAEQAHRSKAGWKQVSGIIRGEIRLIDIKKRFRPVWSVIDLAIRPSMFPTYSRLIRYLNR